MAPGDGEAMAGGAADVVGVREMAPGRIAGVSGVVGVKRGTGEGINPEEKLIHGRAKGENGDSRQAPSE